MKERLVSLLRVVVGLALLFSASLMAVSAQASYHLFYIQEIYSNQDGSVQFIELFTPADNQQFVHAFSQSITSNSNTYPFPTDTPSPTSGHSILLATAGFGAIAGGATPNYTIPAHFFNPAGDTINYGSGFDIDTFGPATSIGPLPTDGSHSLNFTSAASGATSAVDSPRNYAGAGSSVNLAPPVVPTGDYNGNHVVDAADYTLWRDTLGQSVATAGTLADGDKSGTIDAGDFTFWVSKFGNAVPGAGDGASAAGSVPEPSTLLLLVSSFLVFWCRRRAKA
jgi:PEP-CTERM motif